MSRKTRVKVRPRYRSDAELSMLVRHIVEQTAKLCAPVHVSMAEDGKVYIWNPALMAAQIPARSIRDEWLAGVFDFNCPRTVIFDSLRARCEEIDLGWLDNARVAA